MHKHLQYTDNQKSGWILAKIYRYGIWKGIGIDIDTDIGYDCAKDMTILK